MTSSVITHTLIAPAAAGTILEQMPLIDPGSEQGIALQVEHLSVETRM